MRLLKRDEREAFKDPDEYGRYLMEAAYDEVAAFYRRFKRRYGELTPELKQIEQHLLRGCRMLVRSMEKR